MARGTRRTPGHRRTTRAWLAVLCLCGVLLSSCLPEPPTSIPPPPSATPTETATITPTIIWFPATATPTFLPSRPVEPTQDLRPGMGEAVLLDDFTDTKKWQTVRTAAGNIAYGKNELTLAVSGDRHSLTSFRSTPQMGDFYMEIEALPSLCSTGDAYGLLLRAASAADFYRLLVGCDGRLRMERVKNSRAVLLQDWQTSGQLMPGGMIRARIGVWAKGEELRVFVNDVYHFSIKDPVFSSGNLGLYARAGGDNPLTVSFSNLTIYRLDGSSPPAGDIATPTSTR